MSVGIYLWTSNFLWLLPTLKIQSFVKCKILEYEVYQSRRNGIQCTYRCMCVGLVLSCHKSLEFLSSLGWLFVLITAFLSGIFLYHVLFCILIYNLYSHILESYPTHYFSGIHCIWLSLVFTILHWQIFVLKFCFAYLMAFSFTQNFLRDITKSRILKFLSHGLTVCVSGWPGACYVDWAGLEHFKQCLLNLTRL